MLHTNFHVWSFKLHIGLTDEAQSQRLTVKIFKRASERPRMCTRFVVEHTVEPLYNIVQATPRIQRQIRIIS